MSRITVTRSLGVQTAEPTPVSASPPHLAGSRGEHRLFITCLQESLVSLLGRVLGCEGRDGSTGKLAELSAESFLMATRRSTSTATGQT